MRKEAEIGVVLPQAKESQGLLVTPEAGARPGRVLAW